MSFKPRTIFAAVAAAAFAIGIGATADASATVKAPGTVPNTAPGTAAHYDHVFVIVEENHGYSDIVGNPAAPNFNALAAQYGLATNYYGVSHPSEPNYVALVGGDTFGVNNDNAYYVNRVNAPNVFTEFDQAGVSWKAYLQGVPHPGYQGICYPASCNGAPDKDPLYASKHNGIPNFTTADNPTDWSRQVPVEQLTTDLKSGNVPSFGYIVPDECHDQHGDPPYCLDSGNPDGGVLPSADTQDQHLVALGDQYLGQLVQSITGASFWAHGNNAIAITYDEGDTNVQGGGQVPTVVVTSHGPRAMQSLALYNHYSLLGTIQQNFGVACLAKTCDSTKFHHLMTPLLAPTGAAAKPFKAISTPWYATPSPTPKEPVTTETDLPSGGGWQVQAAPVLGGSDNSFGAVAAAAPNDVWAVGNYLPDTAKSNQDATLSLAAHFDGTKWRSTPTVNTGSNFDTLFGVAAVPGEAWAVGLSLDSKFNGRSLIESWNGTSWQLDATPKLDTQRDELFSAAAVSANDVWAVGDQTSETGTFSTLIEHWNGTSWTVVPAPNPGATGDHLYSIAADAPNDVWAVGQANNQGTDTPLVEHWNGTSWQAVNVPTVGAGGELLQGVAVSNGEVWAVGQTDNAAQQATPLTEHLSGGVWTAANVTSLGSGFSDINGVAISGGTAWLVGEALDAASGNQVPIVAEDSGSGWTAVAAPNPAVGAGDGTLGGISAAGTSVWTAGFAATANQQIPLVEFHQS